VDLAIGDIMFGAHKHSKHLSEIVTLIAVDDVVVVIVSGVMLWAMHDCQEVRDKQLIL